MALGKSLLYHGDVHGPAWTAERIAEVTPEQLRAVAEELLAAGLCELTLC